MIIQTDIVDSYLANGNLDDVKEHWIFRAVLPESNVVEEPKDISLETLKQLYKRVKSKLINFTPLNQELFVHIFGPTKVPDSLTVCLIVGAPKGYEAVVRVDSTGHRYIIIDLAQICTYSSDLDRLDYIVFDFITHEVSHVLMGLTYPYSEKLSNAQLLKQLTFDEGVAHFLSYKEDVLDLDWDTEEMKQRRMVAYEKLNYYLTNIDEFSMDLLKKANSGSFWEKFASISGMFAVVEFCCQGGSLEKLLADGPDLLIEIIKKNHELQ